MRRLSFELGKPIGAMLISFSWLALPARGISLRMLQRLPDGAKWQETDLSIAPIGLTNSKCDQHGLSLHFKCSIANWLWPRLCLWAAFRTKVEPEYVKFWVSQTHWSNAQFIFLAGCISLWMLERLDGARTSPKCPFKFILQTGNYILFSPLGETTMYVRWLYCNQWYMKKVAMHFYVWQRKRERELTTGETERENEWEAKHLRGGR